MTASQYKSTSIKLHVNYTLIPDTDLFIFLTFQDVLSMLSKTIFTAKTTGNCKKVFSKQKLSKNVKYICVERLTGYNQEINKIFYIKALCSDCKKLVNTF